MAAGFLSGSVAATLASSVLGEGFVGSSTGAAVAVGAALAFAPAADVGAFLLGPRARPLVICVNCGPGAGGSATGLALAPLSSDRCPAFDAIGGGPRASILARLGLKRSASLPAPARPCCRLAGAVVSFFMLGTRRASVLLAFLWGSVETRRSFSGPGFFVAAEAAPLGTRFGAGTGLNGSGFLAAAADEPVTGLLPRTEPPLPSSALLARPSGKAAGAEAAATVRATPFPSA